MGSDNPTIGVGTTAGGLYVSLQGRATQRICPAVEQIVTDYLDSHPQSPSVVLDLEGCAWIDSTFAGWLVGLHRRVSRIAGARIALAHCSERCRASLEKMQLDSFFDCSASVSPSDVQQVPCATGDRPDKTALKLMLDAHEQLASISASNARIFGPIAETLKRQLEKV